MAGHRRRPAHASDEEVAGVIEEARANGAEIIRKPSPTFYGGYAGGFRDPDGHVWEVAHNPGFGLTDDGSVILPVGQGWVTPASGVRGHR